MGISIYFLRKFGLSYRAAKSLDEDGIELLDLFLQYNPIISEKYSKSKINKLNNFLFNAIKNLQPNSDIYDEIFMLESLGRALGTNKIYKFSNSISEYQHLLKSIDWKEEGLSAASEKLKLQVEKYYDTLNSESHKLEYLRWKNFFYFLNNTYVEIEKIDTLGLNNNVIQTLISQGYLINDSSNTYVTIALDNIIYKQEIIKIFQINEEFYNCQIADNEFNRIDIYTLEEILNQNLDDKDIFIKKLEGKTLNQIGDEYGVSRERIRQKLKVFMQKAPKISECEQYKGIFEKFDISKEVFITIFNSDDRVYELLKLFYKRGSEDISTYILNGSFSEEHKQFILHKAKSFVNENKIQKLSRENLIIEVLKKNVHLQPYFSVEELYYLYSEEIEQYPNLQFQSEASMYNQLERYPNIIFSFKNGYRYHAINPDLELKNKLLRIFDKLPSGAYNMHWVFENNLSFMQSIDIQDGSELHYFCKKYDIMTSKMTLRRNPEFVLGSLNKKDFILSKMKGFDGLSLDDFLINMKENFGLNIDSLASYILSNFSEHIINKNIFFKKGNHTELVLALSKVLQKDIYEINEFKKIITQYVDKSFVTKKFLYEIGYAERGELVVQLKFKSAAEALTNFILSNKIFKIKNEPLYKTPEYYSIIQRLEKDLKILKISNDSYINVSYLESRGFKIEKFLDFILKIEQITNDGEYFSIISLLNNGLTDDLLEEGFDLISLDRLISTSNSVKAVSVGFPNIYCKTKNKKNLNDFLVDQLFEYESVNLEDFTDDINQKYGINLDEYNIRIRLIENGVFYSDALNKVYIDKEDFLNEVYGR